jgi:hypothetical protein
MMKIQLQDTMKWGVFGDVAQVVEQLSRNVGRGIRRSNRGGEYDHSTLYVCTEMSQWNSFI